MRKSLSYSIFPNLISESAVYSAARLKLTNVNDCAECRRKHMINVDQFSLGHVDCYTSVTCSQFLLGSERMHLESSEKQTIQRHGPKRALTARS
jgi:archaellum component FlaF (FlaF/FlaG flagellin family)